MLCSSCGAQLPMEVAYCPTCGAITPYQASRAGVLPFDLTTTSSSGTPTQISSFLPTQRTPLPLQAPPPPPPYEPLDPYSAPLHTPPPPQRRRRAPKVFWTSLISFVASIVVIITFITINDGLPGVNPDYSLDNAVFLKYYPPSISTVCIVIMYLAMLSLFISPIVSVVSGVIWVISKFAGRSRG